MMSHLDHKYYKTSTADVNIQQQTAVRARREVLAAAIMSITVKMIIAQRERQTNLDLIHDI